MRVVADQLKMVELEVVDVVHGRINSHLRQRARLAGELQFGLVKMVAVKVKVAESMDERAWLQTAHLRRHHGEQRVGGDVERHTQKQIRAALIQLAAQLAFVGVKLKQNVARRQGHLVEFARVPRADNVPAARWVVPDLFDDLVDLID